MFMGVSGVLRGGGGGVQCPPVPLLVLGFNDLFGGRFVFEADHPERRHSTASG